jgi:hypothetical protein
MGIDDVTDPCDAQQLTDASGGGVIQGSDLDAAEQARQVRLARHAAPHLSNHPTARDHGWATQLVTGNQRPDIAVFQLATSAPASRIRATQPASLAARAAACCLASSRIRSASESSSSVRGPCSASHAASGSARR